MPNERETPEGVEQQSSEPQEPPAKPSYDYQRLENGFGSIGGKWEVPEAEDSKD